ncbi:MAG: hypothetical protein INR69_17215 [Mucilaginibacter polytrichastri]|nr:hypothetical protein [Mucilaginibacter polytrichastri]
MKTAILSLILSASVATAFAQDNQKPYLTKSLSSANIRSVAMQTSGGSLTVTGVDGGEARLEVYIQRNNWRGKRVDLSKEEIEERLKSDYELRITTDGGKLTAIAKPRSNFGNWKNGLSIAFKAYVPRNVSSDLNTSGGSINIDNVNGSQDFRTSGGSLQISRVTGNINGRTSGGSIRISDAGKSINLQTSGGSIEAQNCSGEVTLSTSGGSLHLAGLKGKINARTSGGSISAEDVSGDLVSHTSGGSIRIGKLSGSLDASTSAGSASVEMLSVSGQVRLAVSAGSATVNLPKGKGLDLNLRASRVNADNLVNFNGTKEKDHVEGKLNGGGIPVDVSVSSGSISFAAN